MRTSFFCFSDSGAKLAERLCFVLGVHKECVHSTVKFASEYGFTPHKSISGDMETLFEESDALIFIGACGIAVREIAPYVKSKTTDPAVIVIDDRGRFVIPILSGHIGGANALARRIASEIGATAVVTTSTDGAGRFSCDEWATANGCAISSMKTAKEVSAAILTRDIPICSDYELPEKLPGGLVTGDGGDLGIYIGIYDRSPFISTLRLIPRTVTLGIGCRRGISKETILAAIRSVLENGGIDIRAVGRIASIDVKKDEEGLISCAEELGAEPVFYSADELNAVQGSFDESEFVRKTVGTGNVCERAAVLAGGELIIKKTAMGGVTVAAAETEWRIGF